MERGTTVARDLSSVLIEQARRSVSVSLELIEVCGCSCRSAALQFRHGCFAIDARGLAQGRVPPRGHSTGLQNKREDQGNAGEHHSRPEPEKHSEKKATH